MIDKRYNNKVSPEKHKDDLRWSRNTRNPYKCMNVMKQDTKDTKEKNAKQRKMKCMQGYLDWSRRCWEFIEKKPTSMDQEFIEDVSSKQRAQYFGSMNQPICRKAVEVKPRNLNRSGICRDSVEKLSRMQKRGFSRGEKLIRWESNKMATQTSIQTTC